MDKHKVKIEEIIEITRRLNPKMTIDQEKLIWNAFSFASLAHTGQTRLSGEDYIVHSISTAKLLAEMHLDPTTIAAGLLHDVPEDTETTLDELKIKFGKEMAQIVEGITKLSKVKYRGIERYAENLRKMFVAMAKDIRTVVIKFSDRIHNLQTLKYQPPQKALRIAKESMEIYAPIADRLGMGEIKSMLEDLSFPYIHPKEYAWVKSITKDSLKHKEKIIEKAKKKLAKELEKNNIEFISISSRVKSIFSIYEKLMARDRNLDRIYDLVAMRVIVKTEKDCYAALGIIHTIWTPLKGRIKDYIAQPKPNNYQSLHTTLFTGKGEVIEIQIRTQEMHDLAEFGIAAHWHYSTSKAGTIPDNYREWINNLVDWQKDVRDSEKYLDDLQKVKLDFFKNRIFVFTPEGDVIDLPENATPIDFAYTIHTDLGNRCVEVLINRTIANLDSKLKNGDVVDIISNKSRRWPNPDWLDFVKTDQARSKIKTALKKKRGHKSLNLRNPFSRE
jgi:GTP diphosphokinase / guanosine-3',5'-bis(diphosphate) 3'-diphosphatase